jgi:hypothetical protein
MPWGVAAAVAGSVVSSALAPSPSSGGGSSGQYYSPTGLGTADQQWQQLQSQNFNTYNQSNLGQYGNTSLQQGMGALGQYGPGYQNAANAAGSSYGALAADMSSQANQNWGTQQQLLGAGQQVFNTAMDPQSALYNRTVQQLQDQTGATNSMYGLGSSAAGAGVANQALGNFNIDWQNQQLQRQATGLQAYDQAAGAAGQYGQLAGAQAAQIPGYQLASGQTPYSTAQGIAAQPGALGNTYGQYQNQNVYGQAQGIQGQAIPYMNYGTGAQAVPYQNQVNGAGAAGALAAQGINSIGSNPQVQSALGSAFGSFGGGSPSGYFGSTGSAGNYGGTGFGGYGLGSGASAAYSGAGNTYGFTM